MAQRAENRVLCEIIAKEARAKASVASILLLPAQLVAQYHQAIAGIISIGIISAASGARRRPAWPCARPTAVIMATAMRE